MPKDGGPSCICNGSSRRTDGWRTRADGFTNTELLGVVSENMVSSVRANHGRVVITALVQRVQQALQKVLSVVQHSPFNCCRKNNGFLVESESDRIALDGDVRAS